MTENIRHIVNCFLIYVDWKPVAILQDKKKALHIVNLAKEKGKDCFLKEMTIPETRMKELGTNIFTRLKGLEESAIKNIIPIRNALIRESMELADSRRVSVEVAWKSVSKKEGTPYSELTYDEFNRWTLDVSQFVLLKR